MTLTDAEYRNTVDILDRSQGFLLRDFSNAVLPAVEALTIGNLQEQREFNLEKVTLSDITRYPKGSTSFLELISEK
jgi:hypothetical protein